VFPKEIIGSSDWLQTLWDRHDVLNDKNVLIAWGMKDIAFREKELNRWIGAFPNSKVVRYPDAGHYVAEIRPDDLSQEIRQL
jgi:haloalkane dehalogenase